MDIKDIKVDMKVKLKEEVGPINKFGKNGVFLNPSMLKYLGKEYIVKGFKDRDGARIRGVTLNGTVNWEWDPDWLEPVYSDEEEDDNGEINIHKILS